MAYTRELILKQVQEENIEFIRLQFTDILGMSKNVEITVEQLEKALDNQIMFDGSSIQGFVRIQESDMVLWPDYDTFTPLPWKTAAGRAARMICDVYTPDGKPFIGCPRYVLRQAIAKAAELGFRLKVGPEPEFFLFKTDENGYPVTETHDKGGYFDLSPIDRGEKAREEIVLALKQMGFKIEAAHHEVAPGQHEIDFKYDDALATADNIATFKIITKMVAQKHGLYASFMPKPIFGMAGSGMHIHQSLFNGSNVFFDSADPLGLSSTARHYMGGILRHSRALTAITNPCVNSYKRLVPGYEAPVYIAWSSQNRSSLVRVPAASGEGSRIEIRNPDPAANPYLALAATLAAGLDGIINAIDPGTDCCNNIFTMTEEQRLANGIYSLPKSLLEAINVMQESRLMKDALGEHVFTNFIRAKSIEWERYSNQVHQWELDEYLNLL